MRSPQDSSWTLTFWLESAVAFTEAFKAVIDVDEVVIQKPAFTKDAGTEDDTTSLEEETRTLEQAVPAMEPGGTIKGRSLGQRQSISSMHGRVW